MRIKLILRSLTILGELVVSFFYSTFTICFSLAFLCTIFLQFTFTIVFMVAPFVGLMAGLPGILLFGWPLFLLMDTLGLRKRVYWMLLGTLVSIPSYYLIMHLVKGEVDTLVLVLGLIIGLATGARAQYQLYLNEEQV